MAEFFARLQPGQAFIQWKLGKYLSGKSAVAKNSVSFSGKK